MYNDRFNFNPNSSTGLSLYTNPSMLSIRQPSFTPDFFSPNFTPMLAERMDAEQQHAFLTQVALRKTLELTQMEGYLCSVAPNGAARYKCLIDAYAFYAAMRINR